MAVQAALQYWKDFNIQEFQRELDVQASEIAQRQDDSDASRKKLVELSREFKKNSTEELRRKVAPLLKSFQGEVDALSRRGQAAETAFLSTYKRIIEIPDPIPVLEQAIVHHQKLMASQDYEIENKQLRETLQQYNSEFAEVKNQEVTINRLREQLKEIEDKLEEKTSARATEKEAELVRAYQEKERDLHASTTEALNKLAQAEVKVATMRSALESTQSELFELKNKFDEEASARAAELDILVTDLERTNQKASSAEKELESLRHQQTGELTTLTQEKVTANRVELELELQARDKEISRLVEDMQRLQSNLSRLREASAVQVQSLEDQLARETATVHSMKETLAAQSDYDEMMRELNVIKMIEFSSSGSTAQEGPTMEGTPSKPLEVLLLEKNRALQNENTALKLELSELREHFNSLQSQHSDTLQTVQEQKVLIGQLEADLLQVQPYIPIRTEGEGQATTPSSAEILSEALRDVQTERRTTSDPSGASSLLPIVSSQRERFKQRNMELEGECHQQRQTISVLQREVDSLRGDNVKLYEKIKFLQSYPGTRRSVDDQDAITRYSSQYEAKLDPFAAFGQREKQRKYMQLSGPDKATLVLGRFILSNKVARMVAFGYTIILHILVFLVLFRIASMEACERDMYAECAKLFTEHMQLFHPEHADEILETFGVGRNPGIG